MYRTMIAVAAIVTGMTAVAAQSDAIQKRNALMSSMWKDGIGPPYKMANGKEPFDQAKAEASLATRLGKGNPYRAGIVSYRADKNVSSFFLLVALSSLKRVRDDAAWLPCRAIASSRLKLS